MLECNCARDTRKALNASPVIIYSRKLAYFVSEIEVDGLDPPSSGQCLPHLHRTMFNSLEYGLGSVMFLNLCNNIHPLILVT
jgi:hypothetical protein